MGSGTRPQVIAIEEHYLDEDVDAKVNKQAGGGEDTRKRLLDLGELRLREMDEAGIDIQVLSHCQISNQLLGVVLAIRVPDRIMVFNNT